MGPFHWSHLLAVGVGGALGAISRYSVVQITHRWWSHGFPLATLAVNVVGCFVIGLAFVFFAIKYPALDPQWRSFIIVGFLGALTTYSSYALEALTLVQQGHISLAVTYLMMTVVLCLLAVTAGYGIGKWLF
jgi:CrcB protein